MPEQHEKNTHQSLDIQPEPGKPECRTQVRGESVLGKIEDATYAALRKHDKQSA